MAVDFEETVTPATAWFEIDSSVTCTELHAEKRINAKEAKTVLKGLCIIILSKYFYLKKFDQAGSLTSPWDAGNLKVAPLKLKPASMLWSPSVIP